MQTITSSQTSSGSKFNSKTNVLRFKNIPDISRNALRRQSQRDVAQRTDLVQQDAQIHTRCVYAEAHDLAQWLSSHSSINQVFVTLVGWRSLMGCIIKPHITPPGQCQIAITSAAALIPFLSRLSHVLVLSSVIIITRRTAHGSTAGSTETGGR